MTKEMKQIYTERITSANRSELIVVLYDIYSEYLSDAITALDSGDLETFRESVRKAEEVLVHLKSDLDFTYEISKELYAVYDYCHRKLSEALYKKDKNILNEANKLMNNLKGAFEDIAKADRSKPIMQNAEKVVYGMTYGRSDVNSTLLKTGSSRGFYV